MVIRTTKALVIASALALTLSACSPNDDDDDDTGSTTTDTTTDGGTTTTTDTPNRLTAFPTSGVPDADSFTIGRTVLNVEALRRSGEISEVTVRLADHLNNNSPVPDGTVVFFTAEGGAIEQFCETTNGACSVTWVGQNPRPADGRATIMAWTMGAESFIDNNSNGLFDDGDVFDTTDFFAGGNDVPEAFRDDDFDGVFDTGAEEFPGEHPGSNDGIYTAGDGLYSGPNCAHSTLCSPNDRVMIWGDTIIVMSDGVANFTLVNADTSTAFANGATLDVSAASLNLQLLVFDVNGNPLPSGTTVTVNASNGTINPASFTVSNSTFVDTFNMILEPDGTSSADGFLQIVTLTQAGAIRTESVRFPVND